MGFSGVPLSLQDPILANEMPLILHGGTEHELTVGPLFSVNVQEPDALNVAVTTLAVPSALSRTPVNVNGLIKGADNDNGPPPAKTSPVKSNVPDAGGFAKVTVIFAVK